VTTTHLLSPPRTGLVTPERFAAAADFHAYVSSVGAKGDLWRALYRTLPLPDDLVERAWAIGGQWRLLLLSEDWCSDAVSSLPLVARLAEQVTTIEVRVLARDQNEDLMQLHLTSDTRSIPVVMLLDSTYAEVGWWGPRPAVLQTWMQGEALELTKEERGKQKRAWYARDRGRTALEEVVRLLETASNGIGAGG
jgi:hypothetical protein